MTAELIYALCGLTSLLCFALLRRGYRRSRSPMLLWCSAAFFVFMLANLLLIVDRVFLPTVDLSLYRTIVTFIGVLLLLAGQLLAT